MKPSIGWVDTLWWLALAVGSSAWSLTAQRELSATFDEPFYLRAGLDGWHGAGNRPLLAAGTMPLPVNVQTLPLRVIELASGRGVEAMEHLGAARAANLVFWWLLLLYGLRWGRALSGAWAGRLTCALLASEPSLLGHATLATTDIALAAAVTIAGYHFFKGRSAGWRSRVLLPGVLFGVAVGCKASALMYVPIVWFVSGVAASPGFGAARRVVQDIAQASMIGGIAFLLLCGGPWRADPFLADWAESLPDGAVKSTLASIAVRTPPLPDAAWGLMRQVRHNSDGHYHTFLNGVRHDRPVWYYFPRVLTMKMPDATLVLLALLLLLAPRSLGSAAGWVTLALLLFSLSVRVQIGVRLVFPLLMFLNLAIAVAVTRTVGWRRSLFSVLAVLAVGDSLIEIGSNWPDTVRYINRIHGGADRGADLLADSNYDWGQGLVDLQLRAEETANEPLYVWHYGGFETPTDRPPLHFLPIGRVPPPEPMAGLVGAPYLAGNETTMDTVVRLVNGRRLAVGLSIVQAYPPHKPHLEPFLDWLRRQEPAFRTRTYFVYDLPP